MAGDLLKCIILCTSFAPCVVCNVLTNDVTYRPVPTHRRQVLFPSWSKAARDVAHFLGQPLHDTTDFIGQLATRRTVLDVLDLMYRLHPRLRFFLIFQLLVLCTLLAACLPVTCVACRTRGKLPFLRNLMRPHHCVACCVSIGVLVALVLANLVVMLGCHAGMSDAMKRLPAAYQIAVGDLKVYFNQTVQELYAELEEGDTDISQSVQRFLYKVLPREALQRAKAIICKGSKDLFTLKLNDFNAVKASPSRLLSLRSESMLRRERRARNSLMVERDDIVAWQQTNLRDITLHRQEGRQIFYLDETWVTAGHTASTVWVDSTVTSSHDAFMRGLTTGLKQPSGKGQRLIVTHIGSEDGFVPGCLDVFRGKKTGDYHEEMDGPRFEKWFDDVLQKLPTGSVIVMDNAPYHSRRLEAVPTSSSRKELIQGWLTSKGIAWDAKMLKRQLLEIVSSVKPQYVKYRVDTVAERAGCTVVRLPPYHCEFNPIELIWAQIKNRVAARNTMFKIGDVERLLKEEAEQVTASNWCNAVRHVVEAEESFKQGGTTSAHIEPIVIALNEGDTSSESDMSSVGPLDDP
ncbi:uncharacterized protein ISCGN_008783 [Ixodes scapularis]